MRIPITPQPTPVTLSNHEKCFSLEPDCVRSTGIKRALTYYQKSIGVIPMFIYGRIFISSSMESISMEFNSMNFVFVGLLKFLFSLSIVRGCIRISSFMGLISMESLSFDSTYVYLQIFRQVRNMLSIRCLYSRRLMPKIHSEKCLFETRCVTRPECVA